MSIQVLDKRKVWDEILKNTKVLQKKPYVAVGYPENKADNSIISYATYNHFGVPGRIPSRPFIAVAVDQNKEKIFNIKKSTMMLMLIGQMPIQKSLALVGTFVRDRIKAVIAGEYFRSNVPNAPSTIKAKDSSKPLIDTGAMRQATTYEVHIDGK